MVIDFPHGDPPPTKCSRDTAPTSPPLEPAIGNMLQVIWLLDPAAARILASVVRHVYEEVIACDESCS